MDFAAFDRLLYPHGKGEGEYRNMVGIDHLILSCPLPIPHIKEVAAQVVPTDFDIETIPVYDLVEYQIAYFMIGLSRIKDYKEQLSFIEEHSEVARSWMTTDLVNQYMKKRDFASFKGTFARLIKEKCVYQRRFAYVMGLPFAKEKEAAHYLLNQLKKDERYYVYMAEAWLLAEIGIYHFEEVYAYLEEGDLIIPLKRKAISKMMDSYRINNKDKDRLHALREKIFA